ncbi:NADPH-dependent FMN reductase [Massilia sp. CF038]|uniref:NADPH-dependent FMN reductase n=1 Tax=Massilia sp. CF038 TaxID=1881045 RepID=UPI000917AF1A|nr:NADPH-dependent FMN reductase [Massilia sp. CF038]SHG62871.1 NAD(P)H-dependent FMN reductase [Massilia sp. CF038]
MKVLGISGSLRKASINSALLRAAQALAPEGMTLTIFDGVGALPLFNPDLEVNMPDPVRALHAAVAQADALLIASPEYGHGVTAVIKNALDWLVSFEPAAGKRVALLNAAPRAHHADLALREILRTMALDIVEPASGILTVMRTDDERAMIADPILAAAIRRHLAALAGTAAGSVI